MTVARAALRDVIVSACAPDVPAERIQPLAAVDTPKGPNPFIGIKWEDSNPVFGQVGPTNVDIWFYDFQRTFARLDPIIQRVKDAVTNAEHIVGADGYTLTQADWIGDSPDIYDDTFQAVLRRTTFRVAARYTNQ